MPTKQIDLDSLHLESGGHQKRSEGVCIMEAVAWWAGEKHSDHPECASPVITGYAMALNDNWPDTARQKLIPFVSRLVGTRDGHDSERGLLAVDWLIRVYTPEWLRLAGLDTEADNLANLAPITDWSAIATIPEPLEEARSVANARWAAARAAAGDAAWAAAGAAAWDALEPTVGRLQESALDLLDRMCEVGR